MNETTTPTTAANTRTAMKFLLRRIARGSGVAPAGADVSVTCHLPGRDPPTVLVTSRPGNQTAVAASRGLVPLHPGPNAAGERRYRSHLRVVGENTHTHTHTDSAFREAVGSAASSTPLRR